jgi:hypothetical protein
VSPCRRFSFVAVTLIALASAGCAPREIAPAPKFAASSSVKADGMTVSVFVSQQELGIADRLTLLIEARRTDGKPIEWPSTLKDAEQGSGFPPNPADPGVTAWNVLEASRRVLAPGHESLELVLEPYLDGDKPIPAFSFETGRGTLVTETIPVKVMAEHNVDAAADSNPVASLAQLSPPLAPVPPLESWLLHPVTLAAAAVGLGLTLVGGAAVVLVRRLRQGQLSPDQRLDLEVASARRVLETGDPSIPPPVVVERIIGVFRQWLVATRPVAAGATGPELIAWLRATGLQSCTELANVLSTLEASRFAAGQGVGRGEAQRLVSGIGHAAQELRAAALQPAGGGG